jgi:hypothetical protein
MLEISKALIQSIVECSVDNEFITELLKNACMSVTISSKVWLAEPEYCILVVDVLRTQPRKFGVYSKKNVARDFDVKPVVKLFTLNWL